MVAKLSTTINKIQSLPNSSNIKILNEFLIYMKNNGSSERHQNNNLNVIIEFAKFLDRGTTFYNIDKKEMIISFFVIIHFYINLEHKSRTWIKDILRNFQRI